MMLAWDVSNGIARRSWARNKGAMSTLERTMKRNGQLKVTVPNIADDRIINEALSEVTVKNKIKN
jgi:urocanate hydratase